MADSIPMSWRLKRRLWARWQKLRFSVSKPQSIDPPQPNDKPVELVPLKQSNAKIPVETVMVYERLPKEEARLAMRVLVGAGLLLNRLVSPMREGLPEIDADVHKALKYGLKGGYAKAFRAPLRPAEFAPGGKVDLGGLAVRGPYSVFLERDPQQRLMWDFAFLGEFEHHRGLRSLAVNVEFAESDDGRRLDAVEIHSDEYGVQRPGDTEWDESTALAVCAATTHLALTRHFSYVHLISGNHWDTCTRNHLQSDHPLYRLVWPHIFNSFYTNHGVTRPQLLPDGDYVNMFSFSHPGLMTYFDAMYERYDITMTDPEADWTRRGLVDSRFECPSHDNLTDLFGVMRDHADRYLHAYYSSDAELRADTQVSGWLGALDALIPNGLGLPLGDQLTRATLARTIGAYIFEGNTMHDLVGTTLWDYQLWADANPTRIYRDGRRTPVDVFQRVINNNFALQLRRAPLLADYGHVALDPAGAELFGEFHQECQALQNRYDTTPGEPWRMEPKNLEINMNG